MDTLIRILLAIVACVGFTALFFGCAFLWLWMFPMADDNDEPLVF